MKSCPAIYFTVEPSPLGPLTLTATDAGLCGIYFEAHKHPPDDSGNWIADRGAHFESARTALRAYFDGRPLKMPSVHFASGTAFQKKVWKALQRIPLGETRTYGQIAQQIGAPNAVRAVGAAVGRNPVSILVPCHRVIGANGSLTGFAGGLERKQWLLHHEAGAVLV